MIHPHPRPRNRKKLSTAKKIAAILSDSYHHSIYLTRYYVEGGIVRGGDEYHERDGKIDKPKLEYTYATDGALQRVVQVWPDGFRRTQFAAKSKGPKVSLKDLWQDPQAVRGEPGKASRVEEKPVALTSCHVSHRAIRSPRVMTRFFGFAHDEGGNVVKARLGILHL